MSALLGRSAPKVGLGAIAFVSAALVGVACTLLNPLDGYSGGAVDAAVPPSAEAVPSADPNAKPDALAPCTLAVPPDRPAPSQNQTKDSFLVAADTLEVGNGQDGYDLDGLCTCPGKSACKPLGIAASTSCDFDGGVDNVLGPETQAALAVLPRDQGASSTSGTDFVRAGRQTFFIQIRGYNGTPNDDDVQVGVFAASDLESVSDAGPPTNGGPRLDGKDIWSVDRDSVLGQGGPPFQARIEDLRAYVRDGLLVAQLDLDLRVGLLRARARESRVTAKITREGSGVRLRDGIISGRIRSGDLLTSLEGLRSPVPTANAHLCRDDVVYQEAKRRICTALDLAAARADDGKGSPCGAISLTLKFSALPANAGSLVSVPVERPCGMDWVDDCSR